MCITNTLLQFLIKTRDDNNRKKLGSVSMYGQFFNCFQGAIFLSMNVIEYKYEKTNTLI